MDSTGIETLYLEASTQSVLGFLYPAERRPVTTPVLLGALVLQEMQSCSQAIYYTVSVIPLKSFL